MVILAQAREITCHLLTFRKGLAGFVPLAELEASAAAGAEERQDRARRSRRRCSTACAGSMRTR